MILQSKIPQGVSMGHHQCEKCCWSPANVRIKAQDGQIHLLSRCLLQPRTLGALSPNEYFCLRNDLGFPHYVCLPCARVACDLEFWCTQDFNILQVDDLKLENLMKERRNTSSRKKYRNTNACHPSMDIRLRTCSGDFYHHPSLGEYPETGEVIH